MGWLFLIAGAILLIWRALRPLGPKPQPKERDDKGDPRPSRVDVRGDDEVIVVDGAVLMRKRSAQSVDLKTTRPPTNIPSRTAKQKKRDKNGRFA